MTQGRNTKLTAQVAESIEKDLSAGMPRQLAATRAGIARSTLEAWIARGRALRDGEPDAPCPTCHATGDDPCTTAKGKPTRTPHAGRHAEPSDGDTTRLLDFLDRVESAEAEAHARNLLLIQNAAMGPQGKWQAAAWFLERRYPELYGRRQLEVSGPNQGPVAVSLEGTGLADGLSDERLLELARRFEAQTGASDHGDD